MAPLVFFADRGLTIGNEAYLMPADGRTGISLAWLRQRMKECRAAGKVLVLDAYH